MDWLTGVLQGIFGSILYDLLLAGMVAALLAYLKAKKERLAGPALYGLVGFTMVMVIAIALTGHALLSKETPQTTLENVEANIKTWAETFSLGIQKQTDINFTFIYAISLPSGRVEAVA
jgi:hypothetical protein